MRVALAQINPTVGDLAGNTAKIIARTAEARKAGAEVVVFPELSICGYPPEDLLHKPHFIADNIQALRSLRKHARGIVLIVGCLDRDAEGRLFNAAAVISDGEIRAMCHKEHLPNYGVFDEKRYFVPGETACLVDINGVRFGVNICEDIWLEGVYEAQSRAGARVLVNLSSSPYDVGKLALRQRLIAQRARETGAFVCYTNAVGGQDELIFDGSSCIYDPRGRCAAMALAFDEDLLVADIAPLAKKQPRRSAKIVALHVVPEVTSGPLPPRRAEPGTEIERIYKALITGTRDYIHKNGFQKAVIGLSGGIDSTMVAAVAVAALGRDHVIGVSMSSVFTSAETRTDARRVAEHLGIAFEEIPIAGVHEAYLKSLAGNFSGRPADVTEENIQARIRGNILMALSNKHGWLVLTTGNKSEMAVGYCTLYGDMSGGYAVLKDLYKTRVYELARFCNQQAGREVIPVSVIERAPSAELRPNQKDQDSLPAYDLLDQILIEYIERRRSRAQIIRKIGHAAEVDQVIRLVDTSEYKRRQAPPGVKVTARAFGKDWRLPITNQYREYC